MMQDENITIPDTSQVKEKIYPTPESEKKKSGKIPFLTFANIGVIILLIGLVILYILFFSSKKTPEPQTRVALQKTGSGSLSVVFLNIDSLNENYAFVTALKNDLESTGKRLQTEVLTEQSNLEKEAADFQRQVANNTITEERAKMVYEELMKKQQSLMEKKERYTQQVAEQEYNLNLRLLDTVTHFLKRYNKASKFDYILTYKTGGDILIANDTLDITNDVVKLLNQEYNERKK